MTARCGVALVLVVACGTTALLRAQSKSVSLTVTASVIRNCTITTAPVNFGAYDPVSANSTNPLDGAGRVTVVCTKGALARIALNPGANDQSGARRMKGGSADAFLNYELYKDAGHTDKWDDTSGIMTLDPAPNRNPRAFTVYGRVAAGQGATTGAYADTVVATVNF